MGICISSSVKLSSCVLLRKEFNWNLDGKDFPLQKFLWHFSKVKMCSLVVFLKDRFWATKIELEAYGSTFLCHGMEYLSSMRGEAMQAPFSSFVSSIQAVPASGSCLVWAVNPPKSSHILHWEGFQEIEDLSTVPDWNSCRLLSTFLHQCLLRGGLLKVFFVFFKYDKIKSVYCFLSIIPWHKLINPLLRVKFLRYCRLAWVPEV